MTRVTENTDRNHLMVSFYTENTQGIYQGQTVLYINDTYSFDSERADYKFMDLIGMLDEEGDIEPEIVFQRSKEKKFIVTVEERTFSSKVYYIVSDITQKRKNQIKRIKRVRDHEE